MKNLLLGLFILLAFTACKKNEDATPDAGATVAGSYQMTALGIDQGAGYNEIALPATTPPITGTGIITTTRTDANNINLSAIVTLYQSTSVLTLTYPPAPATTVPVTLQKNGTSYDMMSNGSKLGTADGTNIAVDITVPASGTNPAGRVVFKGKK